MNSKFKPLSIEELSNAYCLVIANSYRLVEDAEKSFGQKRFISAAASVSQAILEIVRGHIITQAAALQENSSEWSWFWEGMKNKNQQIKFLEEQIHPKVFRNEKDSEKYKIVTKVLKEDFVQVYFNPDSEIFLPPGHELLASGKDKEIAKEIYEYVLSLYRALNIHGLPAPAAQYKIFSHLNSMAGAPS